MQNKKTDGNGRRNVAYLNILGTTLIYLRSPYVVAWWSAAFPGSGHILLSKYIKGLLLFLGEILINMNARVNTAMVYSFSGRFQMAKEALDIRWMLLYIPVYLFAIWDSYRTTVDLNKIYLLAEHENAKINKFTIKGMGINYLDKRQPSVALAWSLLTPGLGQLYIHRLISAIFILGWWVVLTYFSHYLQALQLIFLGDLQLATEVLDPQWLLFMPSVYGFAAYDAYANTVSMNRLYKHEQKNYLQKTYQDSKFLLPQNKG